MNNKFQKWLDSKNIVYLMNDIDYIEPICSILDENDLRPFEQELKEKFPLFEFTWNIEPKSRNEE